MCRTVTAVTLTLNKPLSCLPTCSKGIQTARWMMASCTRGLKPLVVRANSSSRGEKAVPTVGTGSVLPFEVDGVSAFRLDLASLLASGYQRRLTLCTHWTVLFWLVA